MGYNYRCRACGYSWLKDRYGKEPCPSCQHPYPFYVGQRAQPVWRGLFGSFD